MVKSKLIFSFIACIMMHIPLFAQDVTDIKKELNNIKKSPEYIYGQSSGEDEKKCYEIAYDDFLRKLKDYIAANEEFANASAIIIQKMQKNAKTISFERYLNCKVVCVYINKEDIKPIFKSDIIDANEVAIPVIINEVKEQEEIVPFIVPTTIVDVKKASPSTAVSSKEENVPTQSESRTISVENEKENGILNEIVTLKDFSKITDYLNNRKLSSHDVIFKPTTQYGNITNAYWLIFNQSKKLIVVLAKDKTTDVLTNNPTDSKEYSNSPKVWLQIY